MSPSKKPESKEALRDSLRQQLVGDPSAGGGSQPDTLRSKPRARRSRGAEGGERTGRRMLSMQLAFGGPGLTRMAAFCRQLATLIDVGIPLLRSLNILSQRVEHPKLKRVVTDVARRVEEGSSFSDALAAHPDVFSPLVVNVARIGETGGILERSLNQLAEVMERRSDIRKRVAAAMAYPIAAIIVCGLSLMVILGFAIPVFQKIYTSAGVQLPGITRFVLRLSGIVQHYWWLIIIVIAAIVFGFRFLLKASPGVRRMWDLMKIKTPYLSRLSIQVNVTRTCRTLANLLRAGIPLLEALNVAADTSENVVVGEVLKAAHDNVEKGGQLEVPLRKSNVFPPLVVDMIAIGDEAGRLDVMFDKIAETYEADVNLTIRTMNAIIEPALILIMGSIVLVLALAVLLPYWKIGSAISGGGGPND